MTTQTRPRSASSVNTWNLCQRRWAFTYGHLGLREPAGDAAEAGTRVHKWLENTTPEDRAEPVWKKYEIQRMAELMSPLTPPDVVREQVLDIELDGVLFTLRMDFQYVSDGRPCVGDYKTVGKPAGVKTAAKLTDDPQRLLYTRATGAVESFWIYGVWSTFKVKPVKVRTVPEDRERFKLHVLSKAEAMSLVPYNADPLSLPANEDSCMLFPPAGCPHFDKCHDLSGRLVTRTSCGQTVLAQQEEEPAVSDLFNIVPPEGLSQKTTPSAEDVVRGFEASLDALVKPALSSVQPPLPVVDDGKFIDTLYINAIPLSGFYPESVEYAYKYLHEAERMVADSQHVHHVGLIDYSKGYVATEVQLIENIRLRAAAGGAIESLVLETTSRLGKECMLGLMAVSRKVVKGVI